VLSIVVEETVVEGVGGLMQPPMMGVFRSVSSCSTCLAPNRNKPSKPTNPVLGTVACRGWVALAPAEGGASSGFKQGERDPTPGISSLFVCGLADICNLSLFHLHQVEADFFLFAMHSGAN
jgi:hypothetical protein